MGLSGLSWPVWLGLLDVTFTLQAKHRNLHQREKIQSRIGAGFPWLQRSCCKPFCGQVLSSGAWHGLCCPSLPLSSSLSVPKLPCAGSCAAPGVTAWQGLHSTPLARSQLGWLGSAGSTSVEGSGRSDSIPKIWRVRTAGQECSWWILLLLGGTWVSFQLQPHYSTLTLTGGSTRS